MKTLIRLITILIVILSIGMQNVNAQKSVHVSWNPAQCDECPLAGEWFWRVDVEVISYCDESPSTVYQSYQILDSEEEDATFQLTQFCVSEDPEDCYFVVAALKKLCPDGHGGYTIECAGKYNGAYYSCPDLMSSGPDIECPISFQ